MNIGFEARSLQWYSPIGRAVLRLHRSPACELMLVGWEPGQASSLHDHGDSESVVVILEGSLVVVGDEDQRRYDRHDVIVTPTGVRHQLRNESNERALSLHIYAPPTQSLPSPPFIDRSPTDAGASTKPRGQR